MKIKLTPNNYLLIILATIYLFLMHIYIPNLGGAVALPMEYLLAIGIGAVILMGIVRALKNKSLRISPAMPYFLLFIALLLSSSIFNPIKNMDMFLIGLLRLMAGALLWLALLQFKLEARERLTLLLFVFASAVIESVIGLIQLFELYKYLPVITPYNAMVGAFQQRNLLASWTATGLAISLHLITTKRFEGYQAKKVFIYAGVALLTLTIIASSSKTGLIGAASAIALLLGLRWRHYRLAWKDLVVWMLMLCLGTALGLVLLGGFKERPGLETVALQQAKVFFDTGQGSYTRRILMYKASLAMFREKPLFGQGFSNFYSVYMYKQAEVMKAEPGYRELIGEYTNHPHNELLLIIAETGLAGIIAIIVLMAGAASTALSYGRERSGLYTALLLPILFHMFTEFPLHLSLSFYLLFIVIVSIATSHFPKSVRLELPPYIAKAVIALAAGITLVFSIYALATFTAYNLLVTWTKERQKYGEGIEADLMPAAKNLYLRNWAGPFYELEKAKNAFNNIANNRDIEKNLNLLKESIEWSNRQKQRLPFLDVFINEANALLVLGANSKESYYSDEALKTVEEGLSLYPKAAPLQELKSKIAAMRKTKE